MSVLVWEEPPARANAARIQHEKHAKIAIQLRERPGEWAVVELYGSYGSCRTAASQARHGRRVAFAPAADFEFRTAPVDGEFRLYARYVGDGAA